MADFINPYTFIPIPLKETVGRKQQTSGTLSGRIDISVKVRSGSPLFIPNTTKVFPDAGNTDHKHKVFYSYRNLSAEPRLTEDIRRPEVPVIPRSEIRGMIRNMYEQLTNSCYLAVDENNLPNKRTNEVKHLCIMKWSKTRNCWLLYPNVKEKTDYYKGAIFATGDDVYYLDDYGWDGQSSEDISKWYNEVVGIFRNGEHINFDTKNGDITSDKNGGYILHIPMLMKGMTQTEPSRPTANKYIIYTEKNLRDADGIRVHDDTIKRFEYVLGIHDTIRGGYLTPVNHSQNAESVRHIYEEYQKQYEEKEPLIVYADKFSVGRQFQNDVIYLAPAAMSKEFFANTVHEMLRKNGEHQPCSDRNNLCPACRLFGMIGDNGAASGKIRFSDTDTAANISYDNERTLPILGTPRISSTEFYLKKPQDDAKMWNYDYWVTYTKDARGNTVYNRHPYTPVPAGRKVYWNSMFRGSAEKTKMNATVTPIKSGVFRSHIYFDRITKEELEQLLFCLHPSDMFYHKIGVGKPIGMGQISLNVDKVTCCRYEQENGLPKKHSEPYERDISMCAEIQSRSAAKQIICYGTDLDDRNLIDYPRPENGKDIFKWFSANRGSVSAPKIQNVLKPIDEPNQRLNKTPRPPHR